MKTRPPAGRNAGQTPATQFRTDGRPTAQWSRLAAGRSDDLGTSAAATAPHSSQNEP